MIAFGLFEGDIAEMRRDPALAEQQQVRLARIAPHVAATGADGLYEVVEEVRRPA